MSEESTDTIQLREAVTVNARTYSALTLRRPKVKDQLHAQKMGTNDAEREVLMFASLAGVEPAVIEALDLADYVALQGIYTRFLS